MVQSPHPPEPWQTSSIALPNKSAMEDFLFILVISLAVAISMFSKQQEQERFAIPERRTTEQIVVQSDYDQMVPCELPDGDRYRISDREFTDIDSLMKHLRQRQDLNRRQIVLRVARSRSIGDIEDLKSQLFDEGWEIFTEWEKQQ